MVQLLLTSQTHKISRLISQSKNKLQSKKISTLIHQQMTLNEQSWKAAVKWFQVTASTEKQTRVGIDVDIMQTD